MLGVPGWGRLRWNTEEDESIGGARPGPSDHRFPNRIGLVIPLLT